MGSTDPEPIYDLVLIDEAQDLPAAFLEMVYRACSHPKRIVWAYDDLQNVMDYVPVSPAQLFGTGVSGRPRVAELVHVEGEPRSDIILPICYRNTPWALTAAHAVGLGVYRIPTDRREGTGIVQFYDDPRVWKEIGYAVMAGRVAPGEHVRLVRDPASTPGFFRDLLDAEDALVWRTFLTTTAEEEWVATEILKNLTDDGLSARDVMVVSANPFFSDAESIPLVRALTRVGVPAHVAGKAGRRDELFGTDGSVPICHINHAKGNEAPMVYVVHAEHGAFPDKVIRRRNTLFAAITRSRAWVRITGSGPGMETIKIELDRVASHGYAIDLSVPTVRELAQMRRLQRDLTTPKRRDRGRASRNGPDVP
jgi:superfamily I DNA and RNA helicase